LVHRCFSSFARAVIKRYTNFGGAVLSVLRAGTGVEAAIHCDDELWFGFAMKVLKRDQNLAINTERNGPGADLESSCR